MRPTFSDGPDPISEVRPAPIESFEGALFASDGRSRWMLLYNETLKSKGRIRFTKPHELGHYILHRLHRSAFECSAADMLHWSQDDKDMEAQADLFASYLLMPLNDFRQQVPAAVDLEVLGRYWCISNLQRAIPRLRAKSPQPRHGRSIRSAVRPPPGGSYMPIMKWLLHAGQ
jgi:hypothetical protein